jgi:hypothetical protein
MCSILLSNLIACQQPNAFACSDILAAMVILCGGQRPPVPVARRLLQDQGKAAAVTVVTWLLCHDQTFSEHAADRAALLVARYQ